MLLLLFTTPAAGVESLQLSLDSVDGDGWTAHEVEIRLRQDGDRLGASVSIGEFIASPPVGTLRDIRLRCDALSLSAATVDCARTLIRIVDSPLDDRPFGARMHFDRRTRRLEVESGDVPAGGLRLAGRAGWTPAGWTLTVDADDLPAGDLYALIGRYLADLPEIEFGSGSAMIGAEIAGGPGGLESLRGRLRFRELSLTNEEGTLAGEGLGIQAELDARLPSSGSDVDFRFALAADAGEAYLEPAYLDLSASPVRVDGAGRVTEGNRRLELTSLTLDHEDALAATARAVLRIDDKLAIERADVEIDDAVFPGVYETYLQGFLVGTPFAKLETAGRASGTAVARADRLVSLDLAIEGLQADDRDRRIALYDGQGELRWRRDAREPRPRSRFRWGGGFLYRMGFGAAGTEMILTADHFSLPEGLRVPVLDGVLDIDTLEVGGLESESPSVDFDARLEPVGLRRLTTAFGWPPFPGTLSGELRQLSLREGVITVGGSLVAQLFDGTATVSGLRVEEPFGANRSGSADVILQGLDLGLVTDVFTFGRIEGRLDGHIRGLRTLQGRPTAFDASFYTPPDDRSRHRISRRALNNLSEIAGAGTALLSSGFLSFFQNFGYASLGISCRLEGDICHMSGVEPAEVGYYLVKGKGLPRIDVIGHSREVNWPRLVSQIEAALESREATTTESSEGRR